MSVGQLRVSVTTGRYRIWAKRSKNKLLSPKVAPERRKNRIISWEYTWFNRLFRIFLEWPSKNYHLIDRLIRHRLVYYISSCLTISGYLTSSQQVAGCCGSAQGTAGGMMVPKWSWFGGCFEATNQMLFAEKNQLFFLFHHGINPPLKIWWRG